MSVKNVMVTWYIFFSVSELEWSNSNNVTLQVSKPNIVIIGWVCHEVSCVNLQINIGERDVDRTACYRDLLTNFGVLI